jgi:hypothetical protein
MAPIQKAQFQLTTDMKPDTRGPRIGPKVVAACIHLALVQCFFAFSSSFSFDLVDTDKRETLLTIKIAILLPRLPGS